MAPLPLAGLVVKLLGATKLLKFVPSVAGKIITLSQLPEVYAAGKNFITRDAVGVERICLNVGGTTFQTTVHTLSPKDRPLFEPQSLFRLMITAESVSSFEKLSSFLRSSEIKPPTLMSSSSMPSEELSHPTSPLLLTEEQSEEEFALKKRLKKFGKDEKGVYFFDRDPTHFSILLNYLRTGTLYGIDGGCVHNLIPLQEEAKFYELRELESQLSFQIQQLKDREQREQEEERRRRERMDLFLANFSKKLEPDSSHLNLDSGSHSTKS